MDCLQIQRLHTLGLLSGSFLLNDTLQELRPSHYHHQHQIEQLATYTHKIRKALRLMKIHCDSDWQPVVNTMLSGSLVDFG